MKAKSWRTSILWAWSVALSAAVGAFCFGPAAQGQAQAPQQASSNLLFGPTNQDLFLAETVAGAGIFFVLPAGGEGEMTMYASDGTQPGTIPVKQFQGLYFPDDYREHYLIGFINDGAEMVFKIDTDPAFGGDEIWRTDGTELGTQLVYASPAGRDLSRGKLSKIGADYVIFFNEFESGVGESVNSVIIPGNNRASNWQKTP